MKKTLFIVPLLAMVLVLTGCSKKPVEPIDTPPANNAESETTGNVIPEDETNIPETITLPPIGETGGNNETEGSGGFIVPDLKIEQPNLQIINLKEEEEEDSILPIVDPNLNLEFKYPVIEEVKPPIPNPYPGL